MDIHIQVPTNYNPSPTDGDWWKVLYNVGNQQPGNDASDTATFEVQSASAPVHLIPN